MFRVICISSLFFGRKEQIKMDNITTLKLPVMKTIKEIMAETGFSYRHLAQLCHQNKIVYIRTGKKFLINYEKFIEYLNTGDTE